MLRERYRVSVLPDHAESVRAAILEAESFGACAPHPLPPIPGYQLLRELHRGGQGVVFEAIQLSTHRNVAIKFIRGGPLASARQRTRFDREVQILGQLRHPSIVAIHDSGRSGDCVYYVMDLIDGTPLDEWLTRDAGSSASGVRAAPFSHEPPAAAVLALPVRDVIRLFVEICDAVNAAHLRGILHRDLKPRNILVDANGNPHILDFGLGKFMDDAGGSSDGHSITEPGQFIGSLPWSSPEQAAGSNDIDSRSDVYSIGVMLFHAVTRRFPYPTSGNLPEVVQRILTAEAPPPSRLARRDSGEARLDADFDTVVLKCLHKDRERRYQTAGELARDLRHYLAHEPIEAKADSSWYVLKKALRRHWIQASVAAAFVTLLAGAAVGFSVLYTQASQQAQIAQRLLDEKGRTDAAMARNAEAKQASYRYLLGLLSDVGPHRSSDAPATLDALRAAAARLENDLAQQPREIAELRDLIGQIYWGMRRFDDAVAIYSVAIGQCRAALGEDAPYLVELHNNLGLVRRDQRDLPGAIAAGREAYRLALRVHGERHVETAAVMRNLALTLGAAGDPEAGPLYQAALALRRELLTESDPRVIRDCLWDAIGAYGQGRYDEGARLLADAERMINAAFGENSAFAAGYLFEIAVTLFGHGQYAQAEEYCRRDLQLRELGNDRDSLDVAKTQLLWGRVHVQLGRAAEAEPLIRQCLEIRRRDLRSDDYLIPLAESILGDCLRAQGRYDEAAPLLHSSYATLADPSSGAPPDKVNDALQRLSRLEEELRQATASKR
jgi:serine/threonine protein kinase